VLKFNPHYEVKKKEWKMPGMMPHAYNPRYSEAEIRRIAV
jgi:hypothetical protein